MAATARKTTARKTTARKTTARKTTARKTTARKTTATGTATGTATPVARRSGRVAVKLTPRGAGLTAVAVAVLVLVAANGAASIAAVGAFALYMLVTEPKDGPRKGKGRSLTPTAFRRCTPTAFLRGLGWAVAAVAALTALNGTSAPGGTAFGLALAAATATALVLTRKHPSSTRH